MRPSVLKKVCLINVENNEIMDKFVLHSVSIRSVPGDTSGGFKRGLSSRYGGPDNLYVGMASRGGL
jgi:hypothetical protein